MNTALKQRILTGCILVPLVLVGIFYLPLSGFAIIAGIIFLIAAWEWARLIGFSSRIQQALYLMANLLGFAVVFFLPPSLVVLLVIITWLTLSYFIFNYSLFSRFWSYSHWNKAGLGIWLLALSWSSLVALRAQELGALYILFLLLCVWSTDVGAYFIGRKWGNKKLAPHISPGKTVAGFWGGLLVAILVAAGMGLFFPYDAKFYGLLLILAVITALVSVVGDLFESMIKRQSGAKDSSALLPGHGGVLDRIDSLIAAAPVFAAGLWIIFAIF